MHPFVMFRILTQELTIYFRVTNFLKCVYKQSELPQNQATCLVQLLGLVSHAWHFACFAVLGSVSHVWHFPYFALQYWPLEAQAGKAVCGAVHSMEWGDGPVTDA